MARRAPKKKGSGPVIAVVGYNRPASLSRLLTSLARIRVPDGLTAPLVISLDGGLPEVVAVAERFEWPHGDKSVRSFRPNLKLRKHIIACGDLALEHDGVIVLEDDLYVSSDLYLYACAALEAYGDDAGIGGVSLYTHRFVENCAYAFHPLQDAYDTFFVQMPSSWGQLWSRSQWSAFKDWYDREAHAGVHPHHGVPRHICRWSEQSWKKYFQRFLIETKRTFAFPRTALSANCGDPGEHCRELLTDLVTPLSHGRSKWDFAPPAAGRHHDAWFEPSPASLRACFGIDLPDDLAVDFHGFKRDDELSGGHVLSCRDQPQAQECYPLTLLPLAANLQLPGAGAEFRLGPRRSVTVGQVSPARRRDLYRFLNGQVALRTAGELFVDRLVLRIRQKLARK